jgi:hypothetical protein
MVILLGLKDDLSINNGDSGELSIKPGELSIKPGSFHGNSRPNYGVVMDFTSMNDKTW